MPNPRLAARYAKSLIDLSVEKNQLEQVFADMEFMQSVIKSSRDFVNLLRSPIIKGDKKEAIINAITKDKIGTLTTSFNRLLVEKGREEDLPEIVNAFIGQYNILKNIHKITLTTAVAISNDLKIDITSKVKSEAGLENIELETKTDESIIGGFILEFNNSLVDASVARDLRDIKKQFDQNIFIHNIR